MTEVGDHYKDAYEYETLEELDFTYLQVLRKKKPVKVRVVWLLITLAMLVFCIYVVYLLLADYFDYPAYNKITTTHVAELSLPALTICNLNGLNKTKMSLITLPNSKLTLYQAYMALTDTYRNGGTSEGDAASRKIYSKINTENIHRKFHFDMSEMTLSGKFSKKTIQILSKAVLAPTEYGQCLEINDDDQFLQKNSGPVGGLELLLDTQIDHYIDSEEGEGFQIFLRMSNESVMNKGYGFAVKPGEHLKVSLTKTTVTRLGEPHGACTNKSSMYNPDYSYVTMKECKLTNIIWYFLKDNKCRCWPWYVEDRFMGAKTKMRQILTQGSTVEDRLVRYFTTIIGPEHRLNITSNDTCYSNYHYNGTYIDTINNIGNKSLCAEECRNTTDCVAFCYNNNYTTTTEFGNVGSCSLYDSTVKMGSTFIKGVQYGRVNCTELIEECGKSEEELCNNLLIYKLMTGDGPALCGEPCNYIDYTYSLSSSLFPGRNYWKYELSNTSSYNTWAEAKSNLVKISVFYETLMEQYNDQTASYEIQNFIAEFGGLVDLLVGLSFFTIFQLTELVVVWLLKYFKKKKTDRSNDVVAMNNTAC